MDINIDAIRAEVRTWLADNWDPNLTLVEWRTKLVDTGWGMPEWPEDYFGKDMPPVAVSAIAQEFAEAGAIGVMKSGPRMLAAVTLLAHGNDQQKRRFLRRILTGEDAWCQLFSEPGSGSDLAGSTTRADANGDDLANGNGWKVNGQKVWTTSAHHADYGILLARTDWDVPKHQGLSFFVIDMHQPGVEVRQLRQMNGHASFNEVFFTDAVVPGHFQVGELGQGWQTAMTTLAYERRAVAGNRDAKEDKGRNGTIYGEYREEQAIANEPYTWYPQRAGRVDLVVERARETGKISDPAIRQEIAKLLTMHQSTQWFAGRLSELQKAGKARGPEGSITKLAASNVARLASDVHTAITGIDAMLTGDQSPHDGVIAEILVSVPAVSIAGGTDEIQRNIIAERLLGLPKEPRFDTGPFKDVRRN
ncbi:MAG: acyl-CoA dehydrogenase [Alphaproteobacteria bacterium]|nr:MAG: acyl-CoA dehydrogenase [Alphaproteobacteria bacterium]